MYIPYRSFHQWHTVKNYVWGELKCYVRNNTEEKKCKKLKTQFFLRLRTFLYGPERAYKNMDLVNLIAFQLLRLSILLFPFTIIYCFCFLFRFCVCMLHEQFVRYLNALHKLYLAHHDSNCACDCLFCDSCEEIDRFNISWFMRHMLCAPLLRFPGSTTRLYSWDCIENR